MRRRRVLDAEGHPVTEVRGSLGAFEVEIDLACIRVQQSMAWCACLARDEACR